MKYFGGLKQIAFRGATCKHVAQMVKI